MLMKYVYIFIFYFLLYIFFSAEKDGSPLSEERQTVQISLFALLKDLLKSPTAEELQSVLAYAAIVQDEQQVNHTSTLALFKM